MTGGVPTRSLGRGNERVGAHDGSLFVRDVRTRRDSPNIRRFSPPQSCAAPPQTEYTSVGCPPSGLWPQAAANPGSVSQSAQTQEEVPASGSKDSPDSSVG